MNILKLSEFFIFVILVKLGLCKFKYQVKLEPTFTWMSNGVDNKSIQNIVHVQLKLSSNCGNFTVNLTLSQTPARQIPVFTDDGEMGTRFFHSRSENKGIFKGDRSVFVLVVEDSKVTYCKGFFEDKRFTYNVYPQHYNTSTFTHIIQRYRKAYHKSTTTTKNHRFMTRERDIKTSTEDNILSNIRELPDIEVLTPVYKRHREKRQMQLYEIEIFFVIDFSLYSQISKAAVEQTNSATLSSIDEVFFSEILVILHGINARFQNIRGSNYMIDVVLAGIYLSKNISSSSWSKCTKRTSSSRPVITEESLKSFIEWANERNDLPQYDHAMAITACNLQNKDSHKTIGLGYQQSMCSGRRYSIVEHHGNTAYVTYIATHELAHSLGAKHDGYPVTVSYNGITKSCYSTDGYIMSATASSNPNDLENNWRFSECSLLYFEFYIDHLNDNYSNCMTSSNGEVVTSQHSFPMTTIYTADLQCKRTLGQGFVLNRRAANRNPTGICQALPCKNFITNSRESILPLSGTRCGNDRICRLGECVPVTSTTGNQIIKDDQCVFGDQPGSLRIDGLSCKDLKSIENAYLCYQYEHECCNTCKFYERKYLDVTDCKYGDRKQKCSARDCEGNICCETCMLLQKHLPECPLYPTINNVTVNYNSKFLHHGTAAMFSCKPGHILIGNETSICINGKWSLGMPQCISGCLKPVLHENGHTYLVFSEKPEPLYHLQSVIQFKCTSGLTLKGPPAIMCQPNAIWNHSVPICALEFTSPSTIEVNENTSTNKVVHVLSTGNVSSTFKLIYYSYPGFKVTENGYVLVNDGHAIDYELVRSYTMIIEATSVSDYRIQAMQRLKISVLDENEYAPEFTENNICIELSTKSEEEIVNRKIQATDLDLSTTNITYGLVQSSDFANISLMTGELIICKSCIIEKLSLKQMDLEIYAKDSGIPELTSTCTVEIRIDNLCVLINMAATVNCICTYLVYVFSILIVYL